MSEEHLPNSHILHSMVFKIWDLLPLPQERDCFGFIFLIMLFIRSRMRKVEGWGKTP
jgi:hypothetical protein